MHPLPLRILGISSLSLATAACAFDSPVDSAPAHQKHQTVTESGLSVSSVLTDQIPSQMSFTLEVTNSSSTAASDLSVYYYVDESGHSPLSAVVDWASLPTAVSKVSLGEGKSAFRFTLGQAVAAGQTATIEVRLHTADWTTSNFTDDYSARGVLVSPSENSFTGLYQGQTLVFGTDKNAVLDVPLPTSDLNQLEISAQILQQFDSQLTLRLWLENKGTNNIGNVSARYFLNKTGQTGATRATVDWASCSVAASVNALSSEEDEVLLELGSTVLVPGARCLVDMRIHTSDWSSMNFSDDFSFSGLSTTQAVADHLPGYIDGQRVFGRGPHDLHFQSFGTASDLPDFGQSTWYAPAYGVAPDGTRYVYYLTSSGEPRVASYDGISWSALSSSGLETLGDVARVQFVDDIPVLQNTNEVRKWTGTTWELIANPSLLGDTLFLGGVTVDSAGAVYAARNDGSSIQLVRADGAANWAEVGDALMGDLPSSQATTLSASPAGTLYMGFSTYETHIGGQLMVSSFDGSVWTPTFSTDLTFGFYGASIRYLSISDDERITFETAVGGLRSSFYNAYVVDGGSALNFSSWGIGPYSRLCQHPVSVFADGQGTVYRTSSYVEEDRNHFFMETFDFGANAWNLIAGSLSASVFGTADNYACSQTMGVSLEGEVSILQEDGSASELVE